MTDELMINYLLEECNDAERAAVETWLHAREENRAYYTQFKAVWDQSKLLASSSTIDTDESWERLKGKMKRSKPMMHFNRKLYYMAAAVLLAITMFSVYKLINNKHVVEAPIAELDQVIESRKETKIDTLSDKSIVTLNKHAVLNYPVAFMAKERRVKLKGEAFFSITPNKEKPFFIEAANDVEIRVVGTSFNVKSFDAYTEVIVETGIVEVRKFNKVILLHPNERARIDREDSTIVVEKSQNKLYKYYRSKEFECDNTPLWKVVEVLNEAYGDSVVIGRNDLRGLTLTTRFDNESLESILDIISETFEIKVEKVGNKYILK